jgi:hypothetical protein
MTIIEAINKVDALKFNTYSQNDKITWLSKLDLAVKRLILDNHGNNPAPTFTGYTEDTPLDTVLLVPAPFDEIYLRWMEAQIDYYNGENDRYNNSIMLYNAMFDAYAAYYTRHHKPLMGGTRFLF